MSCTRTSCLPTVLCVLRSVRALTRRTLFPKNGERVVAWLVDGSSFKLPTSIEGGAILDLMYVAGERSITFHQFEKQLHC